MNRKTNVLPLLLALSAAGFWAACGPTGLFNKLISSETAVREKALEKVKTLSSDKKSELVPLLIQTLSSDNNDIINRGADALVAIGQEALPSLVEQSQSPDPFIRLKTIESFGRMGPAAYSALPCILTATKDPHPLVRAEALYGLVNLGAVGPDAVAILNEGLSDPMKDVQESAHDLLEKIDSVEAKKALAEFDKKKKKPPSLPKKK